MTIHYKLPGQELTSRPGQYPRCALEQKSVDSWKLKSPPLATDAASLLWLLSGHIDTGHYSIRTQQLSGSRKRKSNLTVCPAIAIGTRTGTRFSSLECAASPVQYCNLSPSLGAAVCLPGTKINAHWLAPSWESTCLETR